MMETTLPVVEITVKPEHMESENIEEDKQNGYNEHTQKVNEEELWIKAEPLEDESQDFIKEDDLGTLSENEARLYEEALNDDCNRNRRSNVPSRKQILVFLDFLNKHRELANCMLRGPTGRHKAQQLWEDITERLNSISGSIKTTQQWQRVWSRQKYLTRKAAATRYACLSIGGLLAPELTPQHEKILTIIGEPIPPRGFCQKPGTPEVRGKPLSKEETKSLLGLIENSKVILSKTTNATNNKMKTEEWQRLANHFNATATVHRRTPQQLRLKWENLKKNARKRSTRIRMNRIQPKLQTLKHPQEFLVVSVPPKSGPVTIELEPQPVFPTERVIPQPELPRQPIIPPRKPYTPRKIESLRKEVSRKSDISQSEVQPTPVIPLDLSKPLDGSPKPVVQEQNEEPPSLSISDLSSPPYTQLEKETNDLKSTLPLKKRLEKRIKLEDDDDDFPKKEKPEEKNVTEDNAQQVDNSQPKMETPLMYSYDTLRNIEIVTIDEEERQKEYQETLKSRQHMRHVCVHCALGFVLKQAFDMHMKVHSPQSGDHECLLCHSRLKTADMLYRHRLRHYRRYRCLLCRTRFKDKDTAACHVMNDHAGQTFECDHCGRGFKRPQYLKRHVEQHHTKPHNLECGVCFRVFHERGWYRSHIRTHNEEVRAKTVRLPVTCEICSRDYKNKASLKRHLLTHDENVHCEICYEKCKNRITLGHHYLKVHNEKYVGAPEQTCPHCDRICATRAMLKRHMQRMHSDRTKKYQCDHCQRLYLTKGEVRAHITWSHMPAEARGGHACTCGRIFRSPSLLRDHKARFHASQPPPRVHQCEHCEKAFANKQVLNRHKKSHSNEMYPCKECGLLFKTQPYVKVHYQIKHLNMTRAQIKAQRKLNKEQLIQNNIHRSTNWEPPINNKKKSSVAMEKEEDPLLVQEGDIQIKLEKEEELQIPTFQTFVDITRE